jgi:hypothetical protein
VAILTCLGLLLFYLLRSAGDSTTAAQLMRINIGAGDPTTFIYSWAIPSGGIIGLLSNVIVANSPQIILSGIYLTYNGLFTCFMLGQEWDRYSQSRKGLRISGKTRSGAQRSTYFLQIPYRFAVPLTLLSGVLHWLCSQSIFLVSIRIKSVDYSFSSHPVDSVGEFLTCGYSPQAILAVVIMGLMMVVGLLAAGSKKYKGVIPMVGSCSVAISALCHPAENENGEDLAAQLLQWGVTDPANDDDGIGNCSFSGQEVSMPIEGRLYGNKNAIIARATSAHITTTHVRKPSISFY